MPIMTDNAIGKAAGRIVLEKRSTEDAADGYFLNTDDAPWSLLMATAIVYSLPPAALYYAVRRYMVTGLTAGATKA
jgi:multiple sugar transport system permease protein